MIRHLNVSHFAKKVTHDAERMFHAHAPKGKLTQTFFDALKAEINSDKKHPLPERQAALQIFGSGLNIG